MRDPRELVPAPVRRVLAVALIALGVVLVVLLEDIRPGEARDPETIFGLLVICAGVVLLLPGGNGPGR